jgi:hypothetical protein
VNQVGHDSNIAHHQAEWHAAEVSQRIPKQDMFSREQATITSFALLLR